MNKTAIKNFAIWARNKLIADIQYRAGLMGITADGIKDPLPQSTGTMEFYDIGTSEPYAITGDAIPQRKKLVEVIRKKENDSNYATAYKYILEEVAYTWFNRLIAIRFMEVNDYLPSHIRVLSSESGKIEPDLVTTPFDAELTFTSAEEETVLRLKNENKLDELFRLLFIKQYNALNAILPALFEKTSDYTELLLNLSVVDQEGVVYHLTHDIPEQDFDITHPDENGEVKGQVEIIGWLYQYYNTEPKNAAFAKNGKITKEEIPAVTQLFTPDWIVRYMVENSLGRIFIDKRKEQGVYADGRGLDEMSWDEVEAKRIANEEEIAGQMGWKYYLPEAAQAKEVRQQLDEIQKQSEYKDVRDIKVIDPCMGSGHILVYAFDVLMQMYENDGYSQRDAAQCILEHNLCGLDIDERAAQLAYFAVMMKARQYDRRIFSRGIQPHVYAIAESNDIDAFTRDYKEISPNSILVSGGQTTVANLFYNMGRKTVGLVGLWDCVAFDEVAGIKFKDKDGIQIMKDYMASGSFARGKEEKAATASMVFVGNINQSVDVLLKTSSLFDPFPPEMGTDTAFLDRIHCYLPGWEIPKFRPEHFTDDYGFITDYLAEFIRELRKEQYGDALDKYFRLGSNLNQRDTIAVRKMVGGLLKLLYPDGEFTKEQLEEILKLALEMRRRVKEQLKKLGGMEFYDVNFSYIDKDNFEEYYVSVPEQGGGKLIPEGMCNPGQVYTVSQGKSGMIGVFRLESQMLPGNGKFERTGLGSEREAREATNTAFNFLKANAGRISGAISTTTKDYIVNYQDMQGIGMTNKLALPTLIALASVALNKPMVSSLAVLGEISIAGTMIKVDELANSLQVCLDSGAKKVLLPITSAADLGTVPSELIGCFNLIFYQSAEDAVYKALGVE